LKNKYTLVAITENKNLHKLFEEKKNFLNKIKHNSFVYSNTRIIVMSYTNIYYFSKRKIKVAKLPLHLNNKKSLNLKKNFVLKNFKDTYLHFVDDDTNFCPKCYIKLFYNLNKKKLDFLKINRLDVKKLNLLGKSNRHYIKINNNLFHKKEKFIISNSSIQLIFYNKKKLKFFRVDRGLGKLNSKIGSENIFISDNIENSKFEEILLACPILHLNSSSGKKKNNLNFIIKSGHLQIIFRNLYSRYWYIIFIFYLIYIVSIKKLNK
jgi:hypothetical protein